MTVTSKLLALFRCDQQLRGLQTRLRAADRFLTEQERQLKDEETRLSTTIADLKRARTSTAGSEGEAGTIDARAAQLREQMNTARTNKEYSAFLTELDALKKRKKDIEDSALETMGKFETLTKQSDALTIARDDRKKIVETAKKDRDTKAAEIKDRVEELKSQRSKLAADVPGDILKIFEELVNRLDDEAMAPVQELDRRNHEWTCGACQVVVPVQVLNDIAAGKFTRCKSCTCILFTEEDVVSKKSPKDEVVVKKTKAKALKKVEAKAEI